MRSRRLGLAIFALLLACDETAPHTVHDHEDEQGHHDHHHGPMVGVTRWTATHELFAEHPPAVVGEPMPFLAHVTVLDGFAPLVGARVRLSLDGPAHVSAEAGMARPGIYRPVVTPTAPGRYQGRLEVLEGGAGVIDGFEVVVFADEAAARAAAPDEDEHEEGEGDDHEEEEGEHITLLKEQQWRVPFATAFAERGELAQAVQVAGELGTPPGGRAHVHAPVAGRVMPGGGSFPTPGQQVEANAVLATLAPTPNAPEAGSRAQADVVDAQVELENARAALARAERMMADQAIPRRQLEEAERRVRVAESSVAASRRTATIFSAAARGGGRGSWRLTTPIGGVVDEVRVNPGEAVEANQLLFRVIDPRERWLIASVPEAWASSIRPEAGARFQLIGEERWRPVTGALVNVSSAVDERSRTVRVIWALDATSPELRVGAAAHVAIPNGDPESGVLVPSSAIVEVEGREVVYLQITGEAFEERAVRICARDGERAVVREGLAVGERVVTRGGYLVRLAAAGGEAGGHAHGHPH